MMNCSAEKNFITLTGRQVTAMEAGLALCSVCHKLFSVNGQSAALSGFCPRCGAKVYFRKPDSIVRTWALVVTALILVFPANLLPIMRVDYLGVPDESTILDGIIYFFKDGSYVIGIIILTASILVPLFKIIGMILMLLSIHFKWRTWLKHKALTFRVIKFIGRWSMLDIFVISILQVLVDFGFFTSTEIAPAATYFTCVVLTTMFAAITFDPRLIWDV